MSKQMKPRDLLKAAHLSDQVGFVLRVAQTAVWDDLIDTFAPFDLRPVHYSVMSITKAVPGSRQNEFAVALNIQRPNVVAVIDTLEERGCIQRKPHPSDRRSHALYLTAEGARMLGEMENAHAAHKERVDGSMSAADRRIVMATLKRLVGLKFNLFS